MNMGKFSDFLSSRKFALFASFFGLYLLSSGTSWALFSYLTTEPDTVSKNIGEARSKIGEGLPKTEECPINGAMFSKPEREIWEKRRPITAIIENHADSRPQSGLSSADVVYEAVAEGGITRFLSVFYCGVSAGDVNIAPVRSVRVYFVDWAAEYSEEPIFVHIGGANNICSNCPGGVKPRGDLAPEVNALKVLSDLGWRYAKGNDFDGGTNIGYPIIVRDQYRLGEKAAWEHSVVGSTDKIFTEAEVRGFAYNLSDGTPWVENFVAWKFADDKASSSPTATEISFNFWDNKSDYDVSWKYDAGTNSYIRFNGGVEHTDHETKEQLMAKNVVVMFVKERGPVDREGHMFYTTTGEGKAVYFNNGEVHEGNWKKIKQADRTRFYDEDGREVSFVRGTIWIEAVPAGNDIKY